MLCYYTKAEMRKDLIGFVQERLIERMSYIGVSTFVHGHIHRYNDVKSEDYYLPHISASGMLIENKKIVSLEVSSLLSVA